MGEDTEHYPEQILKLAQKREYFGRLNDPTAAAVLKGPCGDEMEFYLVINRDQVIEDVRFYTEGCIATVVCGSTAARLVKGKTIDQALSISPADVAKRLDGLPPDHSHCSILAVSTLYRAIANYLL